MARGCAGPWLTVRRTAGKGLLQSKSRHGTDVKLGGDPRRRAAHGAGHACEASIAANVAFVHAMFTDPTAVTPSRRGCFVCVGCRSQSLICSCCDRGRPERAIRFVRDAFFAARSNPSRPSARCSTRKDRGCSHCRTTRRRCSSMVSLRRTPRLSRRFLPLAVGEKLFEVFDPLRCKGDGGYVTEA